MEKVIIFHQIMHLLKLTKIKAKILIALLLLVLIRCSNNEDALKSKVIDFEKDYRTVLDRMTDSLLQIKALDQNYIMEFSAKYDNTVRFTSFDSLDRREDYIDLIFLLSEPEKRFFNKTATGRVIYYKKYNSFFLKPFYFKNGDETLLVIIDKGTSKKIENYKNTNKKIYQNGNHAYYVTNAWE